MTPILPKMTQAVHDRKGPWMKPEPAPDHYAKIRQARSERDLTGKQRAKVRRGVEASGPVRRSGK